MNPPAFVRETPHLFLLTRRSFAGRMITAIIKERGPTRSRCCVSFCIVLLVSCAGLAHGATLTWNNAAGGNWSAASNWSPQQVPTTQDDVVIASSPNGAVVLDVSATVRSIALSGSSSVNVPTNATLAVSSNLNVSAGAIAVKGQLRVNGLNLAGGVLSRPGTILLA